MAARFDVAVVGGGPAGIATSIFASRAGLSTVLFERASGPPDKACGEGVMPAGVRILEALGAVRELAPADFAPFEGIRYIQEDGSSAEARLPAGGGLGIRRTALASALARCAAQSGADLRWDTPVEDVVVSADAVTLRTARGAETAQVCVAADGLHSRIRRRAGLDSEPPRHHRLGLRQHFALPPWSRFVEVHLTPGVEAFVTPAGRERVGVAFLWEKHAVPPPASVESLLRRFPGLGGRLSGVPTDSRPRGAGPLAVAARSCIADRLALVGDAAGYVDAITGEGVSLALSCAQALGAIRPPALERGASRAALEPYGRFFGRAFRRYALACHLMLALARRPRLRRSALHGLRHTPRIGDWLVALALG